MAWSGGRVGRGVQFGVAVCEAVCVGAAVRVGVLVGVGGEAVSVGALVRVGVEVLAGGVGVTGVAVEVGRTGTGVQPAIATSIKSKANKLFRFMY